MCFAGGVVFCGFVVLLLMVVCVVSWCGCGLLPGGLCLFCVVLF